MCRRNGSRLEYQAREVPLHAGSLAGGDPRFEVLISPRGTLDLAPADLAPLDFAFIDGDHSPVAVRHDTWLARGSGAHVIVWHDYDNPPAIGPAMVIDELNRAEGDPICLISGTTICFEYPGGAVKTGSELLFILTFSAVVDKLWTCPGLCDRSKMA